MRGTRLVLLGAIVSVGSLGWVSVASMDSRQDQPREAPSGFDGLTNGQTTQAAMNANRTIFEEREGIADGLGPVFNSNACSACHMNPVTGGISQVSELR